VPAEGQETGLIALNERLECGLIAPTGERYEPLVALKPEQGRAPAKRGNNSTML
jgi:hypothetical protein